MLKNILKEKQDTKSTTESSPLDGSSPSDGSQQSKRGGNSKFVVGATVAGLCFLAFASTRYKVCRPDEYLVKTGIGIGDMQISRKSFVWPGQIGTFVKVNPQTLTVGVVKFENDDTL